MAAASPSVFLLMVNGQVESAQVSRMDPRRGLPQCPPESFPQARGLLSGSWRAVSFRGTSWLDGEENQNLKLGAKLLGILSYDVAGVKTDLERLSWYLGYTWPSLWLLAWIVSTWLSHWQEPPGSNGRSGGPTRTQGLFPK